MSPSKDFCQRIRHSQGSFQIEFGVSSNWIVHQYFRIKILKLRSIWERDISVYSMSSKVVVKLEKIVQAYELNSLINNN